MRARLAVLSVLLSPAALFAQQSGILYEAPPGVSSIGSYVVNCVPKATSSTGLSCGLATDDGSAFTVAGESLVLSGNISAAAWTTNGIKLRGAPGTLTDTSSSGTVAAAYTNVLGGNTIAASNATTFTDYFTMYLKQPVAGSNVTLTNRWSLGTEGGAYFGAGVTLGSGQLLLPTGSAALPPLSFTGFPTTGIVPGTNKLTFSIATNDKLTLNLTALFPSVTAGLTLGATGARWSAGYFGGQTLTNTVTPLWDGSVTWNDSGTTHQGILLSVTDTTSAASSTLLDLKVGGASKFSVRKDGLITTTQGIIIGQAAAFSFGNTRGAMTASADGVFVFYNQALTDFGRLNFGGTTSSFPAIKRNGAGIDFRLADDSNYASITSAAAVIAGGNDLIWASATRLYGGTNGKLQISNNAVSQKLELHSTGAPSVAGSCGTSPSVAGQDTAMTITAGTGSPTSCAVTFQAAFGTAPVCTANAATTTTALNVATTTTTVTVSSVALTASEKIYVTCFGY